jgi:hypothetical protein
LLAIYNRGKFIDDALGSIFGQIQHNVELVVIGWALADNTANFMARYVPDCPKIRFVREQEN